MEEIFNNVEADIVRLVSDKENVWDTIIPEYQLIELLGCM